MKEKRELRGIWIDKKGNTCIGIKPEEPKKEEKEMEATTDEKQKNAGSGRRKRPSK